MTGEWLAKVLLFILVGLAFGLVTSIVEAFVAYPLESTLIAIPVILIGAAAFSKPALKPGPQPQHLPAASLDTLESLRVLYARDEISMLDYETRVAAVLAREEE